MCPQKAGKSKSEGNGLVVQNTVRLFSQWNNFYRLPAFAESTFSSPHLAHPLVDAFLARVLAEVTLIT